MVNKTLGKYELLEILGRGGFGTVYRARETVLEVERAVKVLHPALASDPEFIERFRREARTAARLEHPNIVPVYELDEVQGTSFLAMRYLPGGSLKGLLEQAGRLPFTRALEITRQVASALDYAFQQPEKLVHRDIKPANILFEADGSARLTDFGFAKALAGTGGASLSTSGGMIGTPPYMAPEAWRSQPATPATDVYSLACVFFEMLTGQILFAGDSPPEIMTKHVLDGPQFPTEWPEGTPDGIAAVLEKALSRNVQERYPSAGEFARALGETLKVSSEQAPTREEDNLSPDPFPEGKGSAQAVPLSPDSTPISTSPADLPSEQVTTTEEEGVVSPLSSPVTPARKRRKPPSPSGGSPEERGKLPGERSRHRRFPWKWLLLGVGVIGIGVVVAVILSENSAAKNNDYYRSLYASQTAAAAQELSTQRSANETALAEERNASIRATRTAEAMADMLSQTPTPAPIISPGRIAFSSDRDGNMEIYVMNADGSGLTNLTNDAANDINPAWSPDGRQIAFASNRDGNYEIYVMNADGSWKTFLTDTEGNDYCPTWSPDGGRIAFFSDRDDNMEIYVMNADGSGLINLTNDPASDIHPAWSPDGGRIAFVSYRDDNFEIYVMNADGSGLVTNLTNNDAADQHPIWSMYSDWIGFVSQRDGNFEIYQMKPDGSEQTRLTTDGGYDSHLSLSGGGQVAFDSDRDGNWEIYVMNEDLVWINLTNNPANDVWPSWGP